MNSLLSTGKDNKKKKNVKKGLSSLGLFLRNHNEDYYVSISMLKELKRTPILLFQDILGANSRL